MTTLTICWAVKLKKMISFPDELSVIPSVVIILIAILEMRRNVKNKQPLTNTKTTIFVLSLIFIAMAFATFVQFFIASEESQTSIKAITRWFSLICSILLLIFYFWKHPIKLNQKHSDGNA